MSDPTIQLIYPNQSQTSVPVGAEITVTFDQAVDLSTVKKCIVIYGKDNDMVSGPETATWINEGSGNNPFFLRSPGFTGVTDATYSLIYVDSGGSEVELSNVFDPTVETGASVVHKLIITPKDLLQEEMEYNVVIVGNSEGGASKGICKRTVYEPDTSAVTSTTGEVFVYGGYVGSIDDTLNIEITTSGNIGEMDYKYWLDSDPTDITSKRISSRRFRRLVEGLQIRFNGSDFVSGDVYTVKVYTPEYLQDSYNLTFTTATSTIVEVPSTMSTSPIGTQLPTSSVVGGLSVLEVDPEDGATNQHFEDKRIIVSFDNTIDSSTVDDDAVTILAYPVSGIYGDTGNYEELVKKLTVVDNKIIIDL